MNEQERIQDLLSYEILDTSPERELDELVEIASAICDTPIALITLLDQERQWCKAKIGMDVTYHHRKDSFCQYALSKPDEVLVADDPLHDVRFKDIPIVVGEPHIRFYAGAPIQTSRGSVLGTLCVLDSRPHKISETEKKALILLAKKVIDFLDIRKELIEQRRNSKLSTTQLINLTDQVPGVVYQFRMNTQKAMSFDFLSKGISAFYPDLNPESIKENVQLIFDFIHPEDLPNVIQEIHESFQKVSPLNMEYRVLMRGNTVRWFTCKSVPEKLEDGSVIWYGIFQDVTNRKEYEETLEQISFDISHIIRRPISSLLGLVALSDNKNLSAEQLKEHARYIKIVADELDEFTRKLHDVYDRRKTRK